MNETKQPATSKVVPFTGEFYTELPTTPTASSNAPYFIIIAAALIGGLAIGAIATYQSSDQEQLRSLKAEAAQLEKVKNQVCR